MLEVLLALSVVVNRVVEVFKRAVEGLGWIPQEYKSLVVLLVQLVAGIAVVAFSGQDIQFFPEGLIHEGAEVIIVGLVVGLGSETIHVVVDIMKKLRFEEKAEEK